MADEQAAAAEENTAPAEGAQDADSDGGEQAAPAEQPREERRAQSLNSQFAALKRHQRQMQSERQAFDQERSQFQQQMQLLQKARAEAGQNPEEWLRQGGIDRNTIAKFYEGKQNQAPYDNRFESLQQELQSLRQSLAERDKRAEQFEQQAAQMQRDRYLDTVSREVKAGGDAYELINHYGAYQDVADCQALYHERTGERMSTEEAAERVEGILTSMREDEVRKALASPKLAKRLGWEPKNPETAESEPGAEPAAEAKPDKQPPPRRGKVQPKPRPAKTDANLTPEQLWEQKMRRVNGKGSQL